MVRAEAARQAMLRSEVVLFRLWSFGKAIDKVADGRGTWVIQKFASTLGSLGLRHNRKSLDRLLRQGDGLYWDFLNGYVNLYGYKRVYERLTVDAKVGRMYQMPLKTARKLKLFRAFCYDVWVGENGKSITRDLLEMLFGVSRQTLRSWEKAMGTQIFATTIEVDYKMVAPLRQHAFETGVGSSLAKTQDKRSWCECKKCHKRFADTHENHQLHSHCSGNVVVVTQGPNFYRSTRTAVANKGYGWGTIKRLRQAHNVSSRDKAPRFTGQTTRLPMVSHRKASKLVNELGMIFKGWRTPVERRYAVVGMLA